MSPPLEVKVWAPLACYTRPENKVERVSYPVPTPSAARGVLEAIFWRPEFSWRVREIAVLRPIRYLSLVRNEVGLRASGGQFLSNSIPHSIPHSISHSISIEEARQQRHTLALSEVAYLFRADIVLRSGVDEDVAKYREQFRRSVAKGRCFHRPYLGCREFAADFAPPDGTERPIPDSHNLGLMLFDLVWQQGGSHSVSFVRYGGRIDHGGRIDDSRGQERDRTVVSGTATPVFFQATLERGVLRVPDALYAAPEAPA